MTVNVRRRRENYYLPTEFKGELTQFVGNRILGIWRGFSGFMLDGNCGFGSASENSIVSDGGPFLISVEGCGHFVIYDDDFMDSIVIRGIDVDPRSDAFIGCLEDQDRVGSRRKVKSIGDIDPFVGVVGCEIAAVSIYKLPENYNFSPVGYETVGQCIVQFKLFGGGELLFAAGIPGVNGNYLRITSFDEIDPQAKINLERIFMA
jgi:hypothetical protein